MIRQDIADLKAAIELIEKSVPEGVTSNRDFVNGDHWQNGDGWIGPRPGDDEEGAERVLAEIRKGFTSANRVLEVCERHASGIVGREPSWTFTPREAPEDPEDVAEDDDLKELHHALTVWWNDRQIPTRLLESIVAVLWGTRAVLRLYVPSGIREDPNLVNADTLEDALKLIWVEVIVADRGTVHVDPNSKRELGVIAYKNAKDEDVIEMTYLDDAREATLVEVLEGDAKNVSDPLSLGHRITMHELGRGSIVTEQLRQQQRAHNLALSMLPRNLVTGGFLERIITNAQMPGHWELDPETKEPVRFVPQKLRLGSGTTTFLEGVRVTDQQTGREVVTTPSVNFREPIPVDSSVDGAAATYRTILEEARQAHVLMNTDARASGKSRAEARKDYESSLKPTKLITEAAGRWLLETVLAMAENFYGQPGQYTERYRADFVCELDTGIITADERRQNTEDVKEGILPREYAQRAAGVEDTDAATTLIESAPENQVGMLKRRADIFEVLATHLPIEVAAQLAGFEDDEVTLIATTRNDDEDNAEGLGGGPPGVETGRTAGDEGVA